MSALSMASLVPVSLRGYRRAWLVSDIVAGVTLAAVAIPECMGYAKIAGTPVQTGLYTVVLPLLAFAIFGFSRVMVVGGDAASAALMSTGLGAAGIAGVAPGSPKWLAYAGLVALLTGLLLLAFRALKLGFLADFLSQPALIGFLTGAGIQIAASELSSMLGVSTKRSSFFPHLGETLAGLSHAKPMAIAFSAAGLLLLLPLSRLLKRIHLPAALVYLVAAIAASAALGAAQHGLPVTGHVPSGLPPLALPKVDWHNVGKLLGTAAGVALLVLATSAATARSFAAKTGSATDVDRDLVGLSAANIAAGLSGTFVVNGSATKTAVAVQNGGKSGAFSIIAVATIVVVLLFATPLLAPLPVAALATIVFVIGIGLIDVTSYRRMWLEARHEFWLAVATAAIVAAVGVQQGLLVAVLWSLVLILRNLYTKDDLTGPEPIPLQGKPSGAGVELAGGVVVFRFRVALWFGNAQRFVNAVETSLAAAPEQVRFLIVDAGAINSVDFTAANLMRSLSTYLTARDIRLLLAGADRLLVGEGKPLGLVDLIGAEHLFPDVQAAVEYARTHAPAG